MFSYLSPEDRVPADHPLRDILRMTDEVLRELSPQFQRLYSPLGRRSIAPEKLLRALLLQIFYTVRSERMLMQELNYNLLFRWFVGLNMDEPVWDVTVFSKNRDRLLEGDIAGAFFRLVVEQARRRDLLSSEHFTVDGTLLEAWASVKSYQPKAEPPERGSGRRGELLMRDTHESKTDPDAYLYRKSSGGEFKLSYLGHVLMENRSGLPVAARVTHATADAETQAAIEMIDDVTHGRRRVTLGADKAYDTQGFVQAARASQVTPHVHQHGRGSNIDGRTTGQPGYEISLRKRKWIEPIFGWLKTTAGMRKLRHRGCALVQWMFTLALSAYNLIRINRMTIQAG